MLRWMRVKTRQDNIRNDNIREREVAYKIVETRYRWFERVKRRPKLLYCKESKLDKE
jgi:hypothetical protein